MQERSRATCHLAMPQCCYLAKGAKRPSTIKFDRIPFDPCNSIKRFDLCPFDQKNSTYLKPPIVEHQFEEFWNLKKYDKTINVGMMQSIKRAWDTSSFPLVPQSDQLCLGQKCGIEHAIHALRHEFETPQAEAMLLIDAENAFNSLNRKLALKNIELICPSLINALRNSYESPSFLFVNGKTILSQEGTTQGDPLAMAMYGVALLPLINLVKDDMVTQKWYADDGNAVGSLESLVALHQKLQKHGPAFGYKLTKCNLIVKESSLEKAKKSFDPIDIEIVPGHRVLGLTIRFQSSVRRIRRKSHH